MDLRSKARVGTTNLFAPRVGIGTAPLGNFLEAVAEEVADQALTAAVRDGLSYFDTAPLYGHGLAEQRVGRALAGCDRGQAIVSTKVGRLMRADAPADETQYYKGDPFYKDTPAVGPVWDFSYDGVMTSLEESLGRLDTDRVDILLLHDPDEHYEEASTTAYRALAALRDEGTVSAIGAGMNQSSMLARLVEACDLDVVLCAGRYTLLEQGALDDLLPACERTTTSVVIGGAFNSGVLVDPNAAALYNYVPAPPEIITRAKRLQSVCESFDVPLPAAALQFPLAHPRVSTVLIGFRSLTELNDDLAWLRTPIPAELWEQLRAESLIREDAPVPAGDGTEVRL